ncbi:hypothetical protein M9458_012369, partial [Cirrhinus mrigala]
RAVKFTAGAVINRAGPWPHSKCHSSTTPTCNLPERRRSTDAHAVHHNPCGVK